MVLDSESQRKLLLDLLHSIPLQMDMKALRQGPAPEIRELFNAIERAPLAGVKEERNGME